MGPPVGAAGAGGGEHLIRVAVPEAVWPLLAAASRPGRVQAVMSAGAVIVLDSSVDPTTAPAVVTVLAPGSAGTPHGVRLLRQDADAVLRAAAPGQAAVVGNGSIVLGDFLLRRGRTVPTRIPLLTPDPAALTTLAGLGAAYPTGMPAGTDPAALLSAVRAATDPDRAVEGVLGLGPGLTPSGDDLLAGLLAGLWAAGARDAARRVGAAVLRSAPGRTTLLSADLLGWAARGHAGSEVLAVLAAAGRHPVDRARIDRAVRTLLAVGHTSGADLLAGLVAGLSGSQEFRTRLGGPVRLATQHGKDPP